MSRIAASAMNISFRVKKGGPRFDAAFSTALKGDAYARAPL
jgi:hypothetical protein